MLRLLNHGRVELSVGWIQAYYRGRAWRGGHAESAEATLEREDQHSRPFGVKVFLLWGWSSIEPLGSARAKADAEDNGCVCFIRKRK
jgi:hypothetical protein